MWEQFEEKKDEWIGGKLTDFGDNLPPKIQDTVETIITDIEFNKDKNYFMIHGKDFNCGFNIKYGGISPYGPGMGISFEGYGGHHFHIQRPQENEIQ